MLVKCYVIRHDTGHLGDSVVIEGVGFLQTMLYCRTYQVGQRRTFGLTESGIQSFPKTSALCSSEPSREVVDAGYGLLHFLHKSCNTPSVGRYARIFRLHIIFKMFSRWGVVCGSVLPVLTSHSAKPGSKLCVTSGFLAYKHTSYLLPETYMIVHAGMIVVIFSSRKPLLQPGSTYALQRLSLSDVYPTFTSEGIFSVCDKSLFFWQSQLQ